MTLVGIQMAPGASESSPTESAGGIAWGVRLLQRLPFPRSLVHRVATYKISILLLTYVFYVTYHLARRPLGVTKNVLRQSCVNMTRPPEVSDYEYHMHNKTWCAWEPFAGHDSSKLFSELDFIYRFMYAIGMLVSGYIAERSDIRIFLTCGMLLAGGWTVFGGLAFFWKVHDFSYFIIAQFLAGIFQGTGWPSVVCLMGNWYGKQRAGFIFGVWNSHTSVGNILGSVIAGIWVNDQWGWSFIVPGLIIAGGGVIAFLFVVVKPDDVGLPQPDHSEEDLTDDAVGTDEMLPDGENPKVTDHT